MTRDPWHTYAIVVALATTGLLWTSAAQVPVQDQQPAGSALRPAVMGPSGGVSTGHPLTTSAALAILLKGGNAFDAGVAALLAGGVLEQDLYSLGGEALVLVYPKKRARSRPSSARDGHLPRWTWTGISRVRRRCLVQDSILPLFRARSMPR